MGATNPTPRIWDKARQTLDSALSESYDSLDKATHHAVRTFEDRLAKVGDGPFKEHLIRCKKAVETNAAVAEKQRNFCTSVVEANDRTYRQTVASLSPFSADKELDGFARAAVEFLGADLASRTAKLLLEPLNLCNTLTLLLGHREAKAFEKGALKELLGAVTDPGQNILTLLKRLHAVSTRTLRADQAADEQLRSLKEFEVRMTRWIDLNHAMGKGQSFEEALVKVFGKPVT